MELVLLVTNMLLTSGYPFQVFIKTIHPHDLYKLIAIEGFKDQSRAAGSLMFTLILCIINLKGSPSWKGGSKKDGKNMVSNFSKSRTAC